MAVSPDGANADQITYWNSVAGQKWATLQSVIDEVFAPITGALIDAALPRSGERVLDIGCGSGSSLLAAVHAVGPGGHVFGVDVSEPMLAVARRRIADGGATNVETALADAATFAFERASVDLTLSRFGVMFFDDPASAFANIRTALKSGGRLAFVCWRRMSEAPCFLVPYLAAKPHLPTQPPPDPLAPGPFAFADDVRVRAILTDAGFTGIAIRPADVPIDLGGVEAAAEFAIKLGPTSRVLAEAAPAEATAAEAAIRQAMSNLGKGGRVVLNAGIWVVTAHA